MASLRIAMDAAFWDLNVSSPLTLEGTVRAVPGTGPPPLALERASRTVRPQQLSFLSKAFPLGLIPCFGAPAASSQGRKDKEKVDDGTGALSIQSLFLAPSGSNWWMGFVGQFRPGRLISNIKKEIILGDELEMPQFKDVVKHFLDKSLYGLGLFSQFSLTPDTSLLLNLEKHGDKKGHRTKAMMLHRLPDHDVTLEAAWPELFLESNGTYWEVPSSLSLDITSLISDSGFRYRFGLHRNSGEPEPLNSSASVVPTSLMPGLCAKATFSYERRRDLWREKEKSPRERKNTKEPSSYDDRLKEPHATMSGIIGGSCEAWLGGTVDGGAALDGQSSVDSSHSVSLITRKRKPFNADLFGSLCYTWQHGKFKKDYNDLTRVDACLDINSAWSFLKGANHFISDILKGRVDREVDPLASPRLKLILQQQIAGPIIFRVDSRISFLSPSGKHIPFLEDVMCGLSYSFRLLQSGKILAWFSPKRKEAMVELRLFEF